MRDNEQANKRTLKIELLSQWKLEAEFRNIHINLFILEIMLFQASISFGFDIR